MSVKRELLQTSIEIDRVSRDLRRSRAESGWLDRELREAQDMRTRWNDFLPGGFVGAPLWIADPADPRQNDRILDRMMG